MTVLDLGWRDLPRLMTVFGDLADAPDGMGLTDLLASIGETVSTDESPESDEPGLHFRNPPAPNPEAVQSELVMFRDRFRAAIVKRFGQEYADDVWKRLTQK